MLASHNRHARVDSRITQLRQELTTQGWGSPELLATARREIELLARTSHFLNVMLTVFACFFPLLGVNVSSSFVCSFPACFWFNVNVSVSRPLAFFVLELSPLPETASLPAAGTYTETLSVLCLTE